jgi:hypothetical protein
MALHNWCDPKNAEQQAYGRKIETENYLTENNIF